jgi:hypothetical protein
VYVTVKHLNGNSLQNPIKILLITYRKEIESEGIRFGVLSALFGDVVLATAIDMRKLFI